MFLYLKEEALCSLTLGDSSVCKQQEEQDPRRGAHPHQAETPVSYSTSLSTFPHYKQRVKHINTHNSSVHGGGDENPPSTSGSAD